MLTTFVNKIIQYKNPRFVLDDDVGIGIIFSLILSRFVCFLRAYKLLLFLKFPNKVFLGKGVKFFNVRKIFFGKWVQIGDYCFVSALGRGGVFLGDNVSIGACSRVVVSTSFNYLGEFIKIGNNVGIGEFAYLGGGGGLSIGDDCIIGQYFSCHPENHNYEQHDDQIRFQGTTRKGIRVGSNCWIGAKVTILDGVEVGDGCVVAAGSVVTKNIPENSIVGGVPARVIKRR